MTEPKWMKDARLLWAEHAENEQRVLAGRLVDTAERLERHLRSLTVQVTRDEFEFTDTPAVRVRLVPWKPGDQPAVWAQLAPDGRRVELFASPLDRITQGFEDPEPLLPAGPLATLADIGRALVEGGASDQGDDAEPTPGAMLQQLVEAMVDDRLSERLDG